MNKNFLEKIKKTLFEEKKKLEKKLNEIAIKNEDTKDDYVANFPNIGNEEDENILEVTEFEENIGIENSLEISLQQINQALKRIEENKFGICEKCNKEINEQRLLVFPAAVLCQKCIKNAQNK
ncbi:MAG: TraR/DksA C4-type zinc finger protein [Candidatus Kuenenbacteria bacterium]